MKFRINQQHFSSGLQQVLNIVGLHSNMPILRNVLIEAREGQISLSTTNLDLGVCCQIKADVSDVGKSITLPARKLADIVRELPVNEVFVESGDNHLVEIRSGSSFFKVQGIDSSEFPSLRPPEDQKVLNVSQQKMLSALKSVSYAQSRDENRYILNGVYFDLNEDQKLELVATDGCRLALNVIKLDAVSKENAGNWILPAKTVAELERLLGKGEQVHVEFNERQAAFKIQIDESGDSGLIDCLYLVSKIVEGNYPNYRQIIPKETEHRVKVERELMLECVSRASLMISDKKNSIQLKVGKNLLEIFGKSTEFGESYQSMAIAYDGPDVEIAFSPQFLMEPLKALTQGEIFFEFRDDLSPGLFKTLDNFICVIMPRRLS